ncbi:MAG: tRNA pseudouridine(13) synthase TruD [bacterium]|nr:tRNA pseudouridine(13) synthase TruD [bacterium]
MPNNKTSHADASLWEKDQVFLKEEREKHPELFLREEQDPHTLLTRIGVTAIPKNLPKGYLRFSPFDFLVEEIRKNGNPVTLDGAYAVPEAGSAGDTVYADCMKVGISTLDAAQRIADALGILPQKIGYAGIKDAVAITAQRISIRNTSLEKVQALALPNILFRNITSGKGAVSVGELGGNRFTLFIRTERRLDTAHLANLLTHYEKTGFVNYYGTQRFGTPRFLAHLFGMYLLRGDLPSLVRAYLTLESQFELPAMQKVRQEAAAHFEDWQAMYNTFDRLPYTFRFERIMLDTLIKTKNDYAKVITAMGDQADLWARAYASYCTNRLLSHAITTKQELPKELPLLLSVRKEDHTPYQSFLTADKTEKFTDVLKRFPFIHLGNAPKIEARMLPKVHGVRVAKEGVAIAFDLGKAAYATTFLLHLFTIMTGTPIPDWVQDTEYDTKELLGLGSLKEIKEKLGKYISKPVSS